jgi:phosphatidylserine/phosphatidylglycerophosphate/cardiolipin synthase-like enzyme
LIPSAIISVEGKSCCNNASIRGAGFIDAEHAIAHNKLILIDYDTVITGSFNFTKAAEERNAENLLILRGDADLAAKYRANFELHLSHSRRYSR